MPSCLAFRVFYGVLILPAAVTDTPHTHLHLTCTSM